ncbi:endoribonuclease Dicer 3a-like [Pyrus ussuriensis x Pyrus communis]|uniref:Endoribonuclease Dicer 3a-like n=1 Tax=Pyrus ussuriensis x Pyrus communis TaxID=2448454 RepID=A0A5N5IDB1_9ROSA|nr:endoribonuclease Dicer 3a-like [Pyrus ussuriensis x Pyrus communis]
MQSRHLGSAFGQQIANCTTGKGRKILLQRPQPLKPLRGHPSDPTARKNDEVAVLEKKLGYQSSVKGLSQEAITHASEQKLGARYCYQRLEFLGDSVLDVLMAQHLYHRRTTIDPGQLTDLQSPAVCNENFIGAAVRKNLHRHLQHCSGLLLSHITEYEKLCTAEALNTTILLEDPKVLGDMVESIAGAINMDNNLDLNKLEDGLLVGSRYNRSSKAVKQKEARQLSKELQGCHSLSKRRKLDSDHIDEIYSEGMEIEPCSQLTDVHSSEPISRIESSSAESRTSPAPTNFGSNQVYSHNIASPICLLWLRSARGKEKLGFLSLSCVRTPIEFGEGSEKRMDFNSYAWELSLQTPNFGTISSYDSAVVALYKLQRQGKTYNWVLLRGEHWLGWSGWTLARWPTQ